MPVTAGATLVQISLIPEASVPRKGPSVDRPRTMADLITAMLEVWVIREGFALRKALVVAKAAALPKIFMGAVPTRMNRKFITWRMDITSRLKAVRPVPKTTVAPYKADLH